MAETLESAVQPFLNLVELLQLEELTTPEIAARLNITVPEFQAMYQAARMASQSILDPGKNYLVLDASKNLLIVDIHDFKNVAIYGAFVAVGGLSAYMIWKRDIRPLWNARKRRIARKKLADAERRVQESNNQSKNGEN